MLNLAELQNTNELSTLITKEIQLIQELQFTQYQFKNYITTYTEEVSISLANDEVFKNMLLTSLNSASLQIGINTADLNNLINILEIILAQTTPLEENVAQYNTLFSKVDKNITIVREILQKIVTSFEQLTAISTTTRTLSLESQAKLAEAKQAIMGTDNNVETQKVNSRNIREIEDKNSSDLLCYFPKTDNDILAISTVQNSYKVMFNKEIATVCIEEENFNFSLKTVGVQISNSENILLLSRETTGYFLMTNMPIDVPTFVNVSRITRNKNYVEIGINQPSISLSINNNELTFANDYEANEDTQQIENNQDSVAPETPTPVPTVAPVQPANAPEPIPSTIYSTVIPNINSVAAQSPITPEATQNPIFSPVMPTPNPAVTQIPVTPEINPAAVYSPVVPTPGQPVVQAPIMPEPTPVNMYSSVIPTPNQVVTQIPFMQEPAPIIPQTPQVTPTPIPENATAPNNDALDFTKDNDSLIISERDNQVILPYKLSDVEKQYQKNGKKKYSSVQDLIQNEYVIPTENFKNPIKSRFREAYQLIKKKEHGNLKEAMELGFELMFQSNLNPAIIAACKNLKELDIYLDCLDDNELDKFSCFNIVYNVPPSSKRK